MSKRDELAFRYFNERLRREGYDQDDVALMWGGKRANAPIIDECYAAADDIIAKTALAKAGVFAAVERPADPRASPEAAGYDRGNDEVRTRLPHRVRTASSGTEIINENAPTRRKRASDK